LLFLFISVVLQKVLYILMAVAYASLLILIFTRSCRNNGKTLPWQWIAFAFLAKVTAGIIYGYIYSHYYMISDSWSYFNESLSDYHDLINNPAKFFTINSEFKHLTDFFSTADNAFWSNTGENFLIKLLAVLNVFSIGNYYTDVVLFNAFSFWGLYLVYKVAIQYLPGKESWAYLLIFFWPSCLFWNSAIDKDGLLVFFSGILIYSTYNCILRRKLILFLSLGITGFAGIFLIRNVNAVLFIPSIVCWWAASRMYKKRFEIFLLVYSTAFFLFFLSGLDGSPINLLQQVANKQHQFLSLEANTRLPLSALDPNFTSYIKVFPEALNHIFLRPYITEISSPFHLMVFLENTSLIFLIFFIIIWKKKGRVRKMPTTFNLFLWSVSFTGLLLIGYIVPFPGAIIRYKAFYTMLFILPFISFFNTKTTTKA